MDEEDLREADEARNLATSDGFAGFGSTEQGSARVAGLMDIFRPTGESIGNKLLSKMGWKEGQGIGPKVKRTANIGDGEIEGEEGHLFAPEDTAMISFSHKSDLKGLGYEGESHLQATASKIKAGTSSGQGSDEEEDRLSASLLKPKQTAIKGPGNRAFGVGVLNETGSDDEDPYEIGPKISYSKAIGAEKKSKKKDNPQTHANPLAKTKPTFLSKKLLSSKTSGFRRSRDGRLPLDGFVLADELDGFASISLQDESMKPPVVPAHWKSQRFPTSSTDSQAYVSTADAARASSLNAQTRAALLSEKQLPGKSVFDFLSPAARNKLASASGKIDLPQARSQSPPSGYEASEEAKQKSLHNLMPALDSQVALQALSRGVSGWMPYVEDENKRNRYRLFLQIRAGLLDQLPGRAENATQDDWVNELTEFARAAEVFKPVTGLMASRFTSSSAAPQSVHESDDGAAGEVLMKKPTPKPEDLAVAAAKMGMFGPMTRSLINLYPSRLVCKRFNVQPPENAVEGSDLKSSSTRRGRPSQFDAYRYEPETPGIPPLAIKKEPHEADAKGVQQMPRDSEKPEQVVGIDPAKNEALENERPGQDVFRAIFGIDDDGEDD
jgi:G patch domain-containing protein 1